MASKQQLPRQQPNSSSVQTLIFVSADFDRQKEHLLQGLRRHYSGVENVAKLFYQDNDGNSIEAIQVDMSSSKLAQQLLDQTHLRFLNKVYAMQTLPKSFIVPKIGSTEKTEQILHNLSHNYTGIERISRFYNENMEPMDHIRIDFKSDSTVTKVTNDGYIFINGKRHSIQPYRALLNASNENQKPVANGSSKPAQKYLTETRVKELFAQQQMQLEAMINQFEDKWNARLSTLTNSSTNANADQLLSTFKDFSTVCQQFNQQNAQIQRQLNTLANRMGDVQMKLNGEQQLPIQNGH